MQPADHAPDTIPWETVEARWGVVFPEDYKAFLDAYGPGTIANYLPIEAPTPDGSRDHFGGYAALDTPLDAGILADLECPFPAHPAPGGIFAISGTPDGDTLFYRTAPKPADWHIVTWSRGGYLGEHWAEHPMGLAEFLVAIFAGQLPQNPFGGSDLWEIEAATFEHWELEQRRREQYALEHLRLTPRG